MWLVHLALVAMALYVAVVSGIYFAQTWLLFPTTLVQAGHVRLPASVRRLEIEVPSGDQLVGVHIPAPSSGQRKPLLLGFVRDRPTPTALIVAGRYSIVPARRIAPIRGAITNLVLDRTIEAGHNDLYDRKAFVETLREALAKITAL